jgi:hypothetical protein
MAMINPPTGSVIVTRLQERDDVIADLADVEAFLVTEKKRPRVEPVSN